MSKPNKQTFDARLDLVPQEPGVYIMKDDAGQVIYVGKAINLRQRLRSYFGPNPQGTAKVHAMIASIRDFDYLVAQGELEALVLESNLIKRYQPFYNILLKDDHDYPYIKVTMQELYPRVLKAYRIGPDREEGARYYGPYLNGDVNRAIRTLHELFPMKTCRRVFPRDIGKERPCLNYYINRCIGPCLGTVSAEAYREVMNDVCDYLEGRYSGILGSMRRDMQEAADKMNYEKAARIRDRIHSLEALSEQQAAVSEQEFDADALGIARNAREICILKLEVRSGKISGASTYFVASGAGFDSELTFSRHSETQLDEAQETHQLTVQEADDAAVIAAFIAQYYPQATTVPPLILTGTRLPASTAQPLNELLSSLAGRKAAILTPQRGAKRHIQDMADKNAAETLRRRTLVSGTSQEAIDEGLQLLGQAAGCPRPPARIEAFDVANLGIHDTSCAMVVFVHGKAAKSDYRSFKIRSVPGQDDYASMREAVDRRLDHLGDDSFGPRPDLILVDGGIGHVSTIARLLEERQLDIPVAGMVKDQRHRTRGLALPDGSILELARELGISAAGGDAEGRAADLSGLIREEKLRLLRLITTIQDEAHRRAGLQQRKLSGKRTLKYSLEDIPGIGKSRRQALLRHFGSLKKIAAASMEEIKAVPGMPESAALAVYAHFHPIEDEEVPRNGDNGVPEEEGEASR